MASIRYRSNKWQARIERARIVAEKSFLNKRDAERWARITEAQIERGEYAPPKSEITDKAPELLSDLLDRYQKEVAPQHRSPTTKFNISILKRTLGDTQLSKLNAQAIAQWRDDRLKSVKPPTVARG